MEIFVEVGYYEIYLRPMRENDTPTYYDGVGGIFEKHPNVFRNVKSALNHIWHKHHFDDTIFVHEDLWGEWAKEIGASYDPDEEEKVLYNFETYYRG